MIFGRIREGLLPRKFPAIRYLGTREKIFKKLEI